jgi:hypothetical protein
MIIFRISGRNEFPVNEEIISCKKAEAQEVFFLTPYPPSGRF